MIIENGASWCIFYGQCAFGIFQKPAKNMYAWWQAPAANHKGDQVALSETFSMSNMSPQVGKGFNRSGNIRRLHNCVCLCFHVPMLAKRQQQSCFA